MQAACRVGLSATKNTVKLLPRVNDPQGPRLHAVDGPGRVAALVTDGDGEPPVVGPDQVDHQASLAGQLEVGALTPVHCPLLCL